MIKYVSKLTEKSVALRLPKRAKDANKGTFGKVLVIAGSENYPGAAYLSCAGAYRVGAGLVTLLTSKEVKVIVSRKLPEATFISRLSEISDYDVLLFGPGLGKQVTKFKFAGKYAGVVVDGDGLKIFRKFKQAVLTPHPGEMSRMTGLTIKEVQENREKIAQEFAVKWKQVVVLKGAKTIIASPSGEVKVSTFANPLLATAGTGDILSGIIAGLIAQGLDTNYLFDAACCGVYLHGLAGEMLAENLGDAGMLASDLLPVLPLATAHIQTLNQ